ncbi:LysR substrate-binding domain-containing protein [Sphingomonas sp. G124]|uniref:LysR substrate-binding domain-containing protein n=1 Tax=Sphingomonas cremea TaxID=2904799 RepID=A0A9X1QLD9_9SPHN|nr:LysR substrate-binding domain-containing protein [Sphingomonas cremea]MCF2515535.1 LysR substrate-binding domain-containing protein [Sphingomonas cremea]
MHMPSLQTLRAFDAAGRHQSYSKAGRELGLTHSAISHRIRELEALLGTRLFERKGNRMMPTAEGIRLLGQVRNALGLLESIFSPSNAQAKRRLTISVFPALSSWLVPRLGSFRALHPELDLRLDLSSRPVELGEGIDAAVRYGMGSWTNTDASPLAKEILFPVCSPKYLAEHPVNRPGDLLNCNLLRHPWHSWAAWFEAAGVSAGEPLSGPEYADSSLLIEAAEAGEGVALARELGVADRLHEGKLVRPFDITIPDQRAYYFVRPKGARVAEVDEIESWLANEFHSVQQV